MAKKMGRPPMEISEARLRALLRMKPTLEDTAAYFECSTKTIERFIREHFDCTFVQFREENMVHTRLAIVRKAIEKATKGDNTMLIFCLKNLCGWVDRNEQRIDEVKSFKFSYEEREKLKQQIDEH